jgi:hypothetical protein
MLRAIAKLSCENMSPFSGCDPLLPSGGQEQPRWSFCLRVSPCGAATPLYLLGGEKQPRWNFRLKVSPSKGCNPLLLVGGEKMQLGGSHETKTSAKTAGRDRQGPHAGRGACGGPQSVPGDGRRGARGGAAGLAGAHPARVRKGSGWETRLPFWSRGRGAT